MVHNGGGGGENGNGGSKERRSSSISADPLDDNEAVKTYIRNCRAYDVSNTVA